MVQQNREYKYALVTIRRRDNLRRVGKVQNVIHPLAVWLVRVSRRMLTREELGRRSTGGEERLRSGVRQTECELSVKVGLCARVLERLLILPSCYK